MECGINSFSTYITSLSLLTLHPPNTKHYFLTISLTNLNAIHPSKIKAPTNQKLPYLTKAKLAKPTEVQPIYLASDVCSNNSLP